jgi:AcrR family transcriptional regulator
MSEAFELPVIESESGPRADASRNRERILETAARLFAEHGPECVSMDLIADTAGVGKGTVFRRFGSRAALAAAVLSESEASFQETMIRGEPPLGPGAPARERLIAFGEAVLGQLDCHAALIAAAELGGARFSAPPYLVYRAHVAMLVAQADPGCDAEVLAEMLLAALVADLFINLREMREIPLERLKVAWRELVARALPASADGVFGTAPLDGGQVVPAGSA